MSSGYGSLPRPRYSRAKRAAIVAACASVLTGTAMALPAATFAGDSPPIVGVDLAGTEVDVPDLGVPLPNAELSTDQLPVAPLTAPLDVSVQVDTMPEVADTEPTKTEPTTNEPVSDVPSDDAPSWGEPSNKNDPSRTEPITDAPISDVPADSARTSSGRSTPAQAVAAPAPGSRLVTASPTVNREAATGVLEARTQRQIERAAAIRAAQVLGTEKSAPALTSTEDGLGLRAPLTDLGSRAGVDTLNLASRNGPSSSAGDWNLLPEVLYAVIPLLLAAAAVVAHGRRNARLTAVSVGVVQRRKHAVTK